MIITEKKIFPNKIRKQRWASSFGEIHILSDEYTRMTLMQWNELWQIGAEAEDGADKTEKYECTRYANIINHHYNSKIWNMESRTKHMDQQI